MSYFDDVSIYFLLTCSSGLFLRIVYHDLAKRASVLVVQVQGKFSAYYFLLCPRNRSISTVINEPYD